MRQLEASLADALDGLYAAFQRHRLGPTIAASPGITPEQCDQLLRTELRAFTSEQLSPYAFKAMTTWGTAREYLHFLPRILELAVLGDGRNWPGLNMQLIASKVELAGGRATLRAERQALTEFFTAAWRAAKLSDPSMSDLRLSTCLQGAGVLCGDVTPLLNPAEHNDSLTGMLQLADLLGDVCLDLGSEGRLTDEWGDDSCRAAIIDWLGAPAIGAALEHAFASAALGPTADRLAQALDDWDVFTSHVGHRA